MYSYSFRKPRIENSKWSHGHSMIKRRESSAGVQINSTTFWILGGRYENTSTFVYHDTTEFINVGQVNGLPGPQLPYEMGSMLNF